jgi:hypothetical protein
MPEKKTKVRGGATSPLRAIKTARRASQKALAAADNAVAALADTKCKKKKTKEEKKAKDPNKPKKAVTAYIHYSKHKRPQIKEAHPKMKFGDIGKEVGEAWRKMNPAQKQPYVDAAAKDKARFQDAMKTYKPTTATAAPPSAASAARASAAAASAAPSGSASNPITGKGAWRSAQTASRKQRGARVYYQNKNGELKSFPRKI